MKDWSTPSPHAAPSSDSHAPGPHGRPDRRYRVPRGARQLEAAGRPYGVDVRGSLSSFTGCLAVPGIPWVGRKGLKDGGCGGKPSGESLGLGGRVPPLVSPRRPAGLTGRACCVPDLTSPGPMMGG